MENYGSWRKLFWKNYNLLCNRMAPLESRMRFWKQLVFSLADYRFAMLRPVKTNLVALEPECNRFVSFIVGARVREDESREKFAVRRNKEIRAAKQQVGLDIGRRVCWKLCTWLEHIHRHPAQPCLELLQCQNAQWLASRRSDFGGSQTRTRQHPGMPMRWDTGWVQAVADVVGDLQNPGKDKEVTARKADVLYRIVFG